MDSLDYLIDKISKDANVEKEKVKQMISEKQDELSGLVSDEGAAYIVGRELGISLIKEASRQVKIKNLVPGLRSIEVLARVTRKFDVREFSKGDKSGRVLNIVLGDETGTVRMSLWNEEIDLLDEIGVEENDVIKVSGVFAKVDYRGNPELRLGRGRIQKMEDTDFPTVADVQRRSAAQRKGIKHVGEGDNVEIRACFVQLFNRNPFYEVCPECGKRVKEEDKAWNCQEHGKVQPQHQMVISGVVDDGTGNIRVVLFRELAEKLLGEKTEGLKQLAEKQMTTDVIFDRPELLGKDMIIRGRVRKNDYTENIELIVSELEESDIKQEIDAAFSEYNKEI